MTIDITKLEQLKQLPFNANTDNLIRVLCDIFTETSDNLNALAGEIPSEITLSNGSADGSFKVTITKENDETVVSPDYVPPTIQRIEVTEFPSDFQIGDILIIPLRFDVSVTSEPANWTTAPSAGSLSVGVNANPKPVIIQIGATESTPGTPIMMVDETAYKLNAYIGRVYPVSNWNDTDSQLIQFDCSVFNGGGNIYQSQALTKTNAISYFDDFIRIRV